MAWINPLPDTHVLMPAIRVAHVDIIEVHRVPIDAELDALKLARRQQGLTQRQAAELSGVSTRLWNETELGKRPGLALGTALRMIQTVALDLHLVPRTSRDLIDGGSQS